MSSLCIKMNGTKAASIKEIANFLKERIGAELVYESWKSFDSSSVVLLAFEKYYFRNGSYASLTVMLADKEHVQTADIIGFGGGEGLLNISWGANSNFAKKAADLLQKYGFRRV